MSGPHNPEYDAVIIGSGISGLVCGNYLAKAGMKVLIAEQHHKPEGIALPSPEEDLLLMQQPTPSGDTGRTVFCGRFFRIFH
jgi:thioredoxin reductase